MNKPKKYLLWYCIIAVVIMMLLNSLLLPLLNGNSLENVSYDSFLSELNSGLVDTVELEEDTIYYSKKNDQTVYYTTSVNDPELVERLISADVHFNRVAPAEMSPLLSILLSYGVLLAVFYLIYRLFFKKMIDNMGGNMMSFGKSNAKIYAKDSTGKTFADVAGQEEAKESLREIVDFLHNPQKYADIGAALPKGALLVGPPGTGKTLLAQAVAGEAEVPFFSISGSEFVEMFVGMGAAKVRDLFKQANEKAPCIVFIDEIDTIGKKRDGYGDFGGNDEREQTLNQLLSEMDGFDATRGVVILAATNRPESLDKALLRPGRFDRRIPVELPDLAGREAVLAVHIKKVNHEEDVCLRDIARATAGASGAELANIVNEAALRAVRLGRSSVQQADLEESVEVVLAGQQRKNAVISPAEKEIIAYHEVGHALVAARLKNTAPVHKITIVPRTSGALGYTMQVEEEEKFLLSKEDAFNRIVIYTGGRMAEELVFDLQTSGAANDIEQATRIARAMVTRYGMSSRFGMVMLETVSNRYLDGDTTLVCSSQTAADIDAEVIYLIRSACQLAEEILRDNLAALHLIASFLLEKETLSGEEFMDLLNGNLLPAAAEVAQEAEAEIVTAAVEGAEHASVL